MPDAYNDSAMVAFYLPDELAGRLYQPGYEKPGDLHITLVYLGPVEGLQQQAIASAVQTWATDTAPVRGSLSGLARFTGEDGKEPFVALYDAPQLPAARQTLVELLAPFTGAEQTHGFTPHVTLAYLETGAPAPIEQIEPETVTFNQVALVFGNNVQLFQLMGRSSEMIKHEGDKWILYSADGSTQLGEFGSEEEAKKREGEIQFFKHQGESQTGGHHSRESFESALEATQGDASGRQWDVTIIGKGKDGVVSHDGQEFIASQNGRLYSTKALAASVPLWDGVKVYDNHLTDAEFEARQGMRSVAGEWLGTITKPRWDEAAKALKGVFNVVEDKLAAKLKAAHEAGVLRTIGLSIDTIPESRMASVGGRQAQVIEGFKRIFSVDLVAEPAAGGGFDRLIQSIVRQRTQEGTMELTPEVVALINAAVAKAMAGNPPPVDPAKPTDAPPAAPAKESVQPPPAAPPVTPPAGPSVEEQVRRLEFKVLLKDKLDAAKFPETARRVVETAFQGRLASEAEVDAVIKATREALAAQDPSGRVTGTGGQPPVTAGMGKEQKLEAELLRLVAGNMEFRALEGAKADYVKQRLAESKGYQGWIKDQRPPNYGTRRLSEWMYALLDGNPMTDQRAYEAITTSSMSSIVKNTVNILLAASYAKRTEWWAPLVRTEEVDTIDDATLVRLFGLSTLSVVEEGQTYTEMSWVDEEETAAFVKRGNYVGITLETLLKDKLNVIRSLPERLATSWYNTLSALNSAVFTCNTAAGPVLADTGALFNASAVSGAGGHANLLTTALSLTSFGAARLAMMKQTDQVLGAGQKLMIEPKYLLVPVDLETTALQIRNTEQIPGSANNDVNPYYQKFEVVVVPAWTDATDWALAGDPGIFPAIWNIFLTGKRVPELFTADSEVAGAMFTNDTLRYKIRQMTYRFSSTYDCAPVADFRPLHKNNC